MCENHVGGLALPKLMVETQDEKVHIDNTQSHSTLPKSLQKHVLGTQKYFFKFKKDMFLIRVDNIIPFLEMELRG